MVVGVTIAIYAILSVALNIVVGYAGQPNLAQSAFLGLGAYFAAVLSTRYHLGFWWTIPISFGVAGTSRVHPRRNQPAAARRFPRYHHHRPQLRRRCCIPVRAVFRGGGRYLFDPFAVDRGTAVRESGLPGDGRVHARPCRCFEQILGANFVRGVSYGAQGQSERVFIPRRHSRRLLQGRRLCAERRLDQYRQGAFMRPS